MRQTIFSVESRFFHVQPGGRQVGEPLTVHGRSGLRTEEFEGRVHVQFPLRRRAPLQNFTSTDFGSIWAD